MNHRVPVSAEDGAEGKEDVVVLLVEYDKVHLTGGDFGINLPKGNPSNYQNLLCPLGLHGGASG